MEGNMKKGPGFDLTALKSRKKQRSSEPCNCLTGWPRVGRLVPEQSLVNAMLDGVIAGWLSSDCVFGLSFPMPQDRTGEKRRLYPLRIQDGCAPNERQARVFCPAKEWNGSGCLQMTRFFGIWTKSRRGGMACPAFYPHFPRPAPNGPGRFICPSWPWALWPFA